MTPATDVNGEEADTTEAFMSLILDLGAIATAVPAVRKHPLFLKWFDGPPKMALYEQVLAGRIRADIAAAKYQDKN